ncbi:MAG: lamin tail domain-containing protein [Kiritimatiellae bacterium]|nr:lamin tail domain-containing protein [Kiritimatiellia bacterium]
MSHAAVRSRTASLLSAFAGETFATGDVALALPELPAHVSLVSVTADGVTVEPDPETGAYLVPAGAAVVVTFAAESGYVLAGPATARVTPYDDTTLDAASVPTAIDPALYVSINEIMASNPDPAKDPNALVTLNGGVEMDWVELYNAADVDIDLSGWFFSDKVNKPTKSPIYGSCVVPAHGYKILWLDDAYTNWAPTEAHADIGLSASGEAAVLAKPDGTIADSIVFPQQIKGYSYGPGTVSYGPHAGEGPYVYMKTATPGAANVTEGWGDLTPAVAFSEPHGYKTGAFELALSCAADPNAAIYYTLDGSSPTTASILYTNAIPISKTTVIRAAVPDIGSVLQADSSATYLFLDDILAQEQSTTAPTNAVGFPDSGAVKSHKMLYGMRQSVVTGSDRDRLLRGFTNSIATVSFVIDPAFLFDADTGIYANPAGRGQEWERLMMFEQINPLDPADGFSVPAGLRIRGSNSRKPSYPKHSFRLFFRSSYGMSSLAFPMFPGDDTAATSFDKIDFRCSQNFSWANEGNSADTFIHEVFSRDAQGDMGQFHTRSRYYNVFINGQYWGLYQTQERGEEHFAESYAGGDSLDWDVIKTTSANGGYQLEADEGTMDGWSNLWEIATAEGFEGAHASNYARILGCNPDGTRNPAYPVLLNPTNLMAYALLTHYVVDGDGPVTPQSKHLNNMYCLDDRTDGPTSVGGFFFLRHDGEMSFGKRGNVGYTADPTGWGSGDPDTVDSFNKYDAYWNTLDGFSPVKLHWELEKNADYRRACADQLYRFFLRPDGAMTTEKNIERFAARMAEIDDAIVCEAARWGAGPNGTGSVGSRTAWLNACKTCTNGFLAVRMPYFVSQYKARGWYPGVEAPLAVDALGEPHFAGDVIPAGEKVWLTGSGTGTNLYYTVDGTDPVAADGTAGATAIAYDPEAGIALFGAVTLRARAVSGTDVSALEEVPLSAVSAEYADLTNALRVAAVYTSTTDGGDTGEFIVLTNILDDASISLAGARLVAWNAKKKTEASPSLTIDFGNLVLGPGESVTLDQATWFGGGKLTNSQVGLRIYDAAGNLVQDVFVDSDWWNASCDNTGAWFVAKDFGTNATGRVQWRPTATAMTNLVRVAALYTATLGDGDTGEFIVLTNLSASVAVDLSDMRLVAWNAKKKSEADPSLAITDAFEGLVLPAGGTLKLDQAAFFGGGKLTNSKVGLRVYDPAGALAQDVFVDAGWWDSACDQTGRWFVSKTFGAEAKTDADWEPSPVIIAAVISVADAETGACTTNAVYATLAAAVAAASDGETVLLLADDNVSFTMQNPEIGISKAITIDGDGHTLYGLNDYTGGSGDHDIYISGSGDITIKNIKLANFGGAVPVTGRTYPIWTGGAYAGTLTLDSVTVTNFNRTAFNLNGGTVVVTNCTIAGDLAKGFEGGVFQEGIGVYNANVTVADTAITGAGSTYEKEDSRIAACIQLGNPNGATPGTGSILVRGGTFAGEYGIIVASNALNDVTVQGGTFDGALLAEEGEGGTIVVNGGRFDAPVPAGFAGTGLVPTTIPDNDGMFTVRTARTVAFTVDGASYTNIVVADGEPVAQPVDPAKDDHVFAGWTLEGSAYDFSAPVTADLELAASFTSLASAVWVGGASGDWDTPSNWDIGLVPTRATVVTFTNDCEVGIYRDTDHCKAMAIDAAVTLVPAADQGEYTGSIHLIFWGDDGKAASGTGTLGVANISLFNANTSGALTVGTGLSILGDVTFKGNADNSGHAGSFTMTGRTTVAAVAGGVTVKSITKAVATFSGGIEVAPGATAVFTTTANANGHIDVLSPVTLRAPANEGDPATTLWLWIGSAVGGAIGTDDDDYYVKTGTGRSGGLSHNTYTVLPKPTVVTVAAADGLTVTGIAAGDRVAPGTDLAIGVSGVAEGYEPSVTITMHEDSSVLLTTNVASFVYTMPDFDIDVSATAVRIAKVFYDPEGNEIVDEAVIAWLEDNGFEQDDINALGNDSAGTEEFYAAFINNYDFRVPGAGAALRFTDIAVGDEVSLTVQYVRTAPLGAINGALYFYGANDLAAGFMRSPVSDENVDFGATDPTFATDPTEGTVTQTATATLNSGVTAKFFRATIEVPWVDNGEDFEPEPGGPEEP